MDNSIVERINSFFDFNKMYNDIQKLNIVAWNGAISMSQVDLWLDNFTGEFLGDSQAEKNLALNMLRNYTYYTDREIKHFCKVIYELYIHSKIADYNSSKKHEGLTDAQKEAEAVKNTKFISLGIPSESGSLILYWFRDANLLPKTVFQLDDDIPENLVVLDDVSISGSQAVRYLKKIKNIQERKVYFLCFLCTDEAEKNIKKQYPDITIIVASKIHSFCKAFSDDSVFFSADTDEYKAITKNLFEHYGNKVVQEYPTPEDAYMSKYPLGYGDAQQMFSFFYNTPNNTLPLIWIENAGWNPLFKRTEKIYSPEIEVKNDERFL